MCKNLCKFVAQVRTFWIALSGMIKYDIVCASK